MLRQDSWSDRAGSGAEHRQGQGPGAFDVGVVVQPSVPGIQ